MSSTHLLPRTLELLERAADAFIRNIDPFDIEWMSQNEVTILESTDLSELIGNVLKDYVHEQKTMEGGDDC